MKKLTKIKLINWHLFASQTIVIKNNTLISGENGVGKTTLLDALQYVLIGGKSGVKFNIAANENAKRSVENYMKGKIGAENKKFLRNNDVITHISLEFYDEIKKKFTIMGCVLELPYKGILKEKFYLFNDIKISDEIFISSNNVPNNYQQTRNYLRKFDKNFDFFDTKKQYQNMIQKYLCININKYNQILPKALAFKSLNLQNFVFDFLLESNPINVVSLKNNVNQLKKIENQIQLDKSKLKKLIKIIDLDKEIRLLDNQISINLLLEKMILFEKKQNILKDYFKKQKQILEIIENSLEKKKNICLKIENLNNKILQLKTFQIQDDVGTSLYFLKKDLLQNEKNLNDFENQLHKFQNNLKDENNILKKLLEIDNYSLTDELKQIIEFIDRFSFSNEEDNFLILKDFIKKISYFFYKKIIELNIKQNNLKEEINSLQEKIIDNHYNLDNINSHIKNYPPNIVKLINLIKNKLNNIYKKDVFIYPLCELIEIKDELWRNAIEGFLGARKFNLIIDPFYFDQSLKIYEQYQLKEKIYDVGLVNVQKISSIEPRPNSLFHKIIANDNNALKYIKLLLSNIICEIDVSKLKNHSTAITPQCMIYNNYTARQLNPKNYNIPYIGFNYKDNYKKKVIEEIGFYQKELIKKKENFQKNEHLISLIKNSKINILVDNDFSYICKKLNIQKKEIQEIKKQIEQLKNKKDLKEIEMNLNQLQINHSEENNKLNQILSEIAENKNKEKNYQSQICYLEKELIFLKEELNKKQNEKIIHLEAASIQFKNFLNQYKNNFELISRNIKDNIQEIEKQKNNKKLDIIMLMKLYIKEYNIFDCEPNIENLDFFVQEYNLINFKNLINYEKESKELRMKTEIIFKEEFVNKLKESIENAHQKIKNLNKILKDRPFGNDQYQIIIDSSEDPEYKKYYSIFMEENDSLKQEKPISREFKSYKEIVIDELFQKIISFDSEYESVIYEFLDYRNYLYYDIKIKDKENHVSLFSKIFREKSGGETQVPFYIIIAVCFEQLMVDNTDQKGCLVLFDETFNNMDENRIESMMSFFNELKFQFFIAIPPQRIVNISPFVQTNLIIIKDNNHVIVEDFTKEMIN
ncbi:ATP-binding protein [Candidatus Phytoplasma palmae]|uniref:ATP-binding protein n=1 Tax=Candidatus Phytoplasma palmae TaxID=85624 RepID=UPI00399055F3